MSEERKNERCAGRAFWVWCSVALNLFLIGVLAGSFWGGPPRPEIPPPPNAGFFLEKMSRDLPPEEAIKLKSIFAGEKSAIRNQRDQMQKSMEKIADILAAETPDMDALRQALAEIPNHGQGLHTSMARSMERMAKELSLESRQKIAEKIRHPMMMRRDGRRGRMMSPPPEDEAP